MEYTEIMRAELKVDVYGGEKADEHNNFWNIYAAGDKQDEDSEEDISLSVKDLPPGTRVIVTAPICPDCLLTSEDCNCGFAWKQWIENEYS